MITTSVVAVQPNSSPRRPEWWCRGAQLNNTYDSSLLPRIPQDCNRYEMIALSARTGTNYPGNCSWTGWSMRFSGCRARH